MISVPFAHVGGIPIEETLGSFGPALLVACGAACAQLRAHLRPRQRACPAHEGGAQCKRTGLNSKEMAIIEAAPHATASSDVERPSGRETTARRRRRHDPQSSASAQSSRPRSATSERLAQRPPDAR